MFDGRIRFWWLLRYLLRSRQLRTIPAAAESLDQRHRGGHLFHLKSIQSLLVRQYCRLGNQHIDVGIDAGLVPSLFELKESLGGIHRLLLLLDLLGQNAHFGERIFHLLECSEHGLTVSGEICIVGRDVLLDGGAAQAGVEDGFRERGANGPEAAWPRKPLCEDGTLKAAFGAQSQRRIIGCIRDADQRVGFGHGAFCGGDVRPALEQFRGHADRNRRRSNGHRASLE